VATREEDIYSRFLGNFNHSRASPNGILERAKGIEPPSLAWEARALPLSYARVSVEQQPARPRITCSIQCLPNCLASRIDKLKHRSK
jgi:hypothetical protein